MSNRPRVPTVAPQLSPSERVALAGVTGALALAAVGALVVVPARTGAAVRPARPVHPQVAAERLTPGAPTPSARAGRVLAPVSDVEPLAVAVDAADPARLQVVLPSGPRVVDCNVVRPTVTVTEQTDTVVRLVVSGYEWVPKAAAASGGTTCVTASATAVPVSLAAPLGDRHVYDGASPTATVVADPGDLPAVTGLPAGYHQVSVQRAQPTAGRLVGERTYASGADRLVVRVGPRDQVAAPAQQDGGGLVDGQYVVVAGDARQRCATWTELSGRVRQLCSVGQAPLAAPALLRLARGLTGAG